MALSKYIRPASSCHGLVQPLLLTAKSPLVTQKTLIQRAYASMSTEDAFDPHFLVVSLGNPAPFAKTLHSAGHLALQALQQQLHLGHGQPSFSPNRIAKKATQASVGDKYTLLQCPTLMNLSGPWVAKAWKEQLSTKLERDPSRPLGLVIVCDDLEEDLGVIKVLNWDKTHRGHNGIRSIKESLNTKDYKDSKFGRVAVGIGRPASRDVDTVTDYVLKPWSKYYGEIIYQKSGPGVLAALKDIEVAWTKERHGNER